MRCFSWSLAAGGAIFTWVCYSASRELVAGGAWPLTIGVLGPSLSQVLIQRLDLNAFDAAGFVALNAAAALPLGAF